MRSTLLTAAAVALSTAALGLAGPAGAAPAANPSAVKPSAADGQRGLQVVGLTDGQRLVQFHTDDPGSVWGLGKVRGLKGDRKLVGIDYRVQNGKLYGVGDKGGVYTLNTRDAKAKKVSKLTVALDGKHFGVDFNPAANRLRVISDTGQNLRHNIDDPAAPRTTTVDGTLAYPAVPPATSPTTGVGVTGAGYTNNDLNANTSTTLFDIDTSMDQVVIQSPANAGTLAATGELGVNAGPSAGFDVYYEPRDNSNRGFAALKAGGSYRFYRVSLLDGETNLMGSFPRDRQVVDVALPLDQGDGGR